MQQIQERAGALTSEQAHALAKSLSGMRVRLRDDAWKFALWARAAIVRVRVVREAGGERIEFSADRIVGNKGATEPLPRAAASICREVSSEERVLAHFWGFVFNVSGLGRPVEGSAIRVRCGSSPDGWRLVRVDGPRRRRVAVSGAYKHGGAYRRDVRWSDVWLVGGAGCR